jgi:hypothetical protein
LFPDPVSWAWLLRQTWITPDCGSEQGKMHDEYLQLCPLHKKKATPIKTELVFDKAMAGLFY